MKYQRLTREQFEELHQEFINFLATQSITASEWKELKVNKSDIVEQELDIFSDLIWEGVLKKVRYLENISAYSMQLFHIGDKKMELIAVKLTHKSHDLTTKSGFQWFKENLKEDSVEFFTASKEFSEDKYEDIFQLILQGSVITKGALYQSLDKFIKAT
ncbi:DUF6495 family protein [Ascidiimonas sp. W6]|uniref:DUF6495 family protein n=1 Tax=Ascidiimonas meishanensis TaxID=3128903 RepID=UPI0030EF9D8C